MENTSKALLIAGSILIAIILIALAVRTINSTSGTQEQFEGAMQTTEMAQFNSKFTAHVGTNKSRAQVISLLNLVIANNATSNQKVMVNNTDSVEDKINSLTDTTYTIKIKSVTGYNNGYVRNISITYKQSGEDTEI